MNHSTGIEQCLPTFQKKKKNKRKSDPNFVLRNVFKA